MILRRVIQHFRKQEWTAIAIDFVIVVAGVFVGLQVSEWNTARHDRARAAEYSGRLADDLDYEARRFAYSRAYYGDVRAAARRLAAALDSAAAGEDALSDEALLIEAYRASQYFYFPPRRATFDELVSTGDIGLIADWRLREAAITIYADTTIEISSEEAKSSDFRRLFRRMTPAPFQEALLARCGDRDAKYADDGAQSATLDYPCTLEMPAAEIAAAALRLRSSPEFLEALQLRLADLETAVVNIEASDPQLLPYFRERQRAAP